tara:strand:- start:9407 stop:10480 length:1074 start_codon:yes stop_codon:yes gene_type:complete
MEFYYMDAQGTTQGPVDENYLRSIRAAGTIHENTYLAAVGSAEWKTFAKVFPDESAPPPTATGAPPPPGTGNPPPPATGASPPPTETKQPPSGRQCYDIDYEIKGDDIQVVEIELDSGETAIAEAEAINYMEEGINFEAKLGNGSTPEEGFFEQMQGVGKCLVTAESFFLTHFTNNFGIKRKIAFAAPHPGKIVPINMGKAQGEVTCQKDSFLCAALGTEVSIALTKDFGAGLFGTEGFVLQKIKGDGMVFLHAGGTVLKKELRGEILRVDTGCIVGFTSGVNWDYAAAGNLKSVSSGGKDLFLATLSGTGSVWLQSLPFSRLADRIIQSAQAGDEAKKNMGSVLSGIGRKLRGKSN